MISFNYYSIISSEHEINHECKKAFKNGRKKNIFLHDINGANFKRVIMHNITKINTFVI